MNALFRLTLFLGRNLGKLLFALFGWARYVAQRGAARMAKVGSRPRPRRKKIPRAQVVSRPETSDT